MVNEVTICCLSISPKPCQLFASNVVKNAAIHWTSPEGHFQQASSWWPPTKSILWVGVENTFLTCVQLQICYSLSVSSPIYHLWNSRKGQIIMLVYVRNSRNLCALLSTSVGSIKSSRYMLFRSKYPSAKMLSFIMEYTSLFS